MMNKKEVLIQLKKRIEEQGVIGCEYVTDWEGKRCFCTVGHLMDMTGVDLALVEENWNSDAIGSFKEEIIQPILDTGLTYSDLQLLQMANDDNHLEDARKQEVLDEIDAMLKEMEK